MSARLEIIMVPNTPRRTPQQFRIARICVTMMHSVNFSHMELRTDIRVQLELLPMVREQTIASSYRMVILSLVPLNADGICTAYKLLQARDHFLSWLGILIAVLKKIMLAIMLRLNMPFLIQSKRVRNSAWIGMNVLRFPLSTATQTTVGPSSNAFLNLLRHGFRHR